MRARTAAVLLVVALLVFVSVGYLLKVSSGPSSETSIIIITSTPAPEKGIMQCVVTRYIVTQVVSTVSSNVTTGLSTESTDLLTYLTTTTQTLPIGVTTAFTTSYSTYSGVVGLSNVTLCEYISG